MKINDFRKCSIDQVQSLVISLYIKTSTKINKTKTLPDESIDETACREVF